MQRSKFCRVSNRLRKTLASYADNQFWPLFCRFFLYKYPLKPYFVAFLRIARVDLSSLNRCEEFGDKGHEEWDFSCSSFF